MEIITGYFISRGPAIEAEEYLRNGGFKGEISIIGHNNQEDSNETGNMRSSTDDMAGVFNYGVLGGFAGMSGGSFMAGSGSVVAVGPIPGTLDGVFGSGLNGILNSWEIPEKEEKEIKSVVKSGNTVILIKCEDNKKEFIRETLQEKGAQNIHS